MNNGNLTYITNSERSTAACPQKWLLAYGLQLRPKRTAKTLAAGTLYHDALDAYFRKAMDTGTASDEARCAGTTVLARWKLDRERIEEKRRQGAMSHETEGWDHFEEDMEIWRVVSDVYLRYTFVRGLEMRDWRIVHNEMTLSFPAVLPGGIKGGRRGLSTRTGIAGKVDRVVKLPSGELWLMEHKLTSIGLPAYRDTFTRSPQAATYGWLMAKAKTEVRGVLYDLAWRQEAGGEDELPVLQSGQRLAKPQGIPKVTAETFRARVESVHGMALEDAAAIDWQKPAKDGSLTGEPKMDTAWYLDTWRRLVEADRDRWFLLHARPWNERDIPRVQEELYLHATQIRRWHDQLEVYVDNINRGEMTLQEVLDIAQPEYPRSPGMCQQYGRLCPYYDTCSTGQLQSDLHRVPVRHMELTDTQDDQGELA